MDNKDHYKLTNQKTDIETVKQQAGCQITVGRGGRSGGDNRSTEGLVYMHTSTTNGHKTLGREGMYGGGNGMCTQIIIQFKNFLKKTMTNGNTRI